MSSDAVSRVAYWTYFFRIFYIFRGRESGYGVVFWGHVGGVGVDALGPMGGPCNVSRDVSPYAAKRTT